MAENSPGDAPRFGLALVCALHAVPLCWAAAVLPWRASWFTFAIGLLGLLHVVVIGLALASRWRALLLAWKTLSIYSLVVLATVTWIALTSALYLSELYGQVGRAVSAGLFAAWAVCALFTLPISCWGLARTVRFPPRLRRLVGLASGAVVVVAAVAGSLVARSAQARELEGASPKAFERAAKGFSKAAEDLEAEAPALAHYRPAPCARPVDQAPLTLLLTSLDGAGKPAAHCLQAADVGSLVGRVRQTLAASAAPDGPALLDLVTAVRPIPRLHPMLDAFSLRPARDGACAHGRCLAPWQLVALDAFGGHSPLPGVASARLGVSLEWLANVLEGQTGQLTGISTQSYVLDQGVLRRQAGKVRGLDRAKTLGKALRLAEQHIVTAQQESGAFRYTLDPFSGQADGEALNIARQAGTALVLCELGQSRQAEKVARRALKQLLRYEQRVGDFSVLTSSAPQAKLVSSSLPLVALCSCRERLGAEHDELIGRLSGALLAFQRENGGFFAELDMGSARAHGDREPLYATGQAVLALVLLEQLSSRHEIPGLPETAILRSALDRAMDRYADYWPSALRDLFFLEENWHCLAARAALGSHRHDGYERFCSDYVAFKSRLILAEVEGVEPSRVGGYSPSNVLPPHTTTSAGFAEALAAAIAVKRARGEHTAQDEALLRQVLGFLLRQQWTAERCVACASGKQAIGGFSESEASPIIRIDYVQHAMAALGHGGRILGMVR